MNTRCSNRVFVLWVSALLGLPFLGLGVGCAVGYTTSGGDQDTADDDVGDDDTGDDDTGDDDTGDDDTGDDDTGDDDTGDDDTGDDDTSVDSHLIDDLEDGDDSIPEVDGRMGSWYTYNDGSVGGQQTPASNVTFAPTAGGPAGSSWASRTEGSGFSVWGAGMGFDLNNDGVSKGVYDLSAHDGITFQAKGNTGVRISIAVEAVVHVDYGGTCVPGPNPGQECDDAHGMPFSFTNSWQQYTLPFAQALQEGWGQSAPFDPTTAMSVLFDTAEGETFDIWIDDVRFYP